MTTAAPARLAPIVERRITGMTVDATGAPTPVTTPYIIGHGQQLARQRLGDLAQPATTLPPAQRTKKARKAAVTAAVTAARKAAEAAVLAAMRANPATISLRKIAAQRAAERKERAEARRNKSPFRHLHRAARERAILAAAAA